MSVCVLVFLGWIASPCRTCMYICMYACVLVSVGSNPPAKHVCMYVYAYVYHPLYVCVPSNMCVCMYTIHSGLEDIVCTYKHKKYRHVYISRVHRRIYETQTYHPQECPVQKQPIQGSAPCSRRL